MFFDLLTREAMPIHNGSTAWLETILQELASFLKIILEFVAILIIAIALLKAVQQYIRHHRHPGKLTHPSIRLKLGLTLSLALEFLLAADIVGTAVSPTWDEIAKLAAITGIRTFLNFFLHREVQELQEISQSSSQIEL